MMISVISKGSRGLSIPSGISLTEVGL